MPASKSRAWIETTHNALEQRTEWRVVADNGDVVQRGAVIDDVAGTRAYDAAQQWATRNGLAPDGWKHAVAGHESFMRSRTVTDKTAPVRLYGWANCADGGREGVAVTPQEMQDLESGRLACPVCGEACSATLEPSAEVKMTALVWNGTRWHGNRA
jgi:hypothetical protein